MTTQEETKKTLIANGWIDETRTEDQGIYFFECPNKKYSAFLTKQYISIRYYAPTSPPTRELLVFDATFNILDIVGDTLISGPLSFRLVS